MIDQETIRHRIAAHRAFFATGRTRGLAFRREQLRILRRAVIENEPALFGALAEDLGKPAFEAYGGETGIVVAEIDHALRHLRAWSTPRRVRTPIALLPARCSVVPEPYGVALIVGPWNFPVQLTLGPLVGALAAGNCGLLKPSIAAPATSRLLSRIVADRFDPGLVSLLEGGAETAQALFDEKFDYLFFTGGVATGRIAMAAAARHLTPVTLELGGKNPCIVDDGVDLEVTARRVVWGKFFNAGQSCVAVDHLFVDRRIKDRLLSRIVATVRRFYGDDPSVSPDFGRIVNAFHVDRLAGLMTGGAIVAGGQVDRRSRYVAPTIIDNIAGGEPVMEDEIFGPILPVLTYDRIDDVLAAVNSRPRPLALYVFSRDRRFQERVLAGTSSGGACVNDTTVHEVVSGLPFGGVGDSGMGKYHGKAGFDTFSHERSIVRNSFLPDITLRYPPYKDHLRFFRKFF